MNPIQTVAGWFGGQGGKRARKTLTIAFVALLAFSVVAPFLGFVAVDADHAGTAAAAEGDQEWSYATSGSIAKSSPTVVDGTAYVGSGDNSLYAIDASTGSKEWSYAAGNSFGESSPTVVDGTVYAGSIDNSIYAVDASTGSLEWSAATGASIRSSPTVSNGVVFVGSDDGNLYAYDKDTGSEKWNVSVDVSVKSSPTVVNGTVYVGAGDFDYGHVYAFDADTGSQEWKSPQTGNTIRNSPTVANGTVFIGSYDGNLYAFDQDTGSQDWSFAASTDIRYSSPTEIGGTVFIGDANGMLYAVDASTGSKDWNTSIGNNIHSSPTVANGLVYVGSGDNSLHVLDADTGSEQWSFATGNNIESSPTVADGTVFFGSNDNSLYAVDTGDAGAYSEGSRVDLRTLGHHDQTQFDTSPVSGTVADTDGNALEGANVTLEQSGTVLDSATTNASGSYEFTGVEDGDYTVAASMDGYHDDAEEITVAGDPVTVDFNLSAIESDAAGEGQAIGLVEDDLGLFPPDDTELVVYHRTSEYKPLWQASGDSPEDWKQYSWSEVATASFNWENRTWVGLTDGEYYRLEIDSRHGTWEDSGFRYDKAEMLGSTVWLRPETGHLDSNDDGTAGGSSSSGTNGPGDGSDSTSDDDSGADDDGFGPTALGSCTTTDGQDGVEVEYWDSGYETYELRANLSVDGESTYFIHKSFDSARGYYRGCLADAMTDNASSSRDTVFEHNATDLDGAVVSSGSTSYEPPIFGPSGVAPASTVERLGLLAGVLGALGALWFGGQRYVPGTAVEAWPVDSVSPAFGVGAPLVAVLGLDLAGGGVISAGLATGLAQIAPFAGIVGVTIAGYYALRWIRAPPSS